MNEQNDNNNVPITMSNNNVRGGRSRITYTVTNANQQRRRLPDVERFHVTIPSSLQPSYRDSLPLLTITEDKVRSLFPSDVGPSFDINRIGQQDTADTDVNKYHQEYCISHR